MNAILHVLALCALALPLASFAQDPESTSGPGAPSAQSPVPDCVHFKHYRDTLTGNEWHSSGSPCTWTDSSGSLPAGVSSDGSNGLQATGALSTGTQFNFPDSSKQVTAAYNTPGIIVSPSCPTGSTSCIKIFGDTKFVSDATTNSTTTLTCPDCDFTSADVGKVAWATTQGSGVGQFILVYTTSICPQTTIASVTNSTTVVLNNACTVTSSGNVVFIWGHDDGPTLAAISYGCNVIHAATSGANLIMTSQPVFNANSCSSNLLSQNVGPPAPALVGDGYGASQAGFVLTPNFAWASCQTVSGASGKVCFGGGMRTLANLQIWGTGLTSAANSNCANGANMVVVSAYPPSSVIYGVDVAGICPGTTGMRGLETNGADETLDLGGAQSVGFYACSSHGPGQMMSWRGNDCRNDNVTGGYGMIVDNGAYHNSWSNTPINATLITGSGTIYNSYGSTYAGGGGNQAIEVQNGATFNSLVDNVTASFLVVDAGGTVYSTRTAYAGSIEVFGTFIDGGGNKTGVGIHSASTGIFSGTSILFGSCRGTATSSATLGLYGLGQFSTQNCTSTTVNQGQAVKMVPISGSVLGLMCKATHAGVNASSGVVTVLKNGSPTSITCTIGTGTSCIDASHFDIPTLGDVYSVQFTTQASEVLAGVTCTLLDW